MNHLQPPTRQGAARILTAFLLVGAALLVLTPNAQAVNSDWTNEYADSLSQSVKEISLAHDGEKLGMLYSYVTTGAVGFSTRSSAGVWNEQNAAVIPGANGATTLQLTNAGAGNWIAFGLKVGTADLLVYQSTDDGVTWTETTSFVVAGSYDSAYAGGKVALAVCNISGQLYYWRTSDNGVTWDGNIRLDDTKGNPADSSATHTTCASPYGVAIWAASGGAFSVYYGGGGSNYDIFAITVSSSFFATVPYYGGGSCPSGCASVDSETTKLPLISNGRSTYLKIAVPKNVGSSAVVMTESFDCSHPVTFTGAAALPGRGDIVDVGGSCDGLQAGFTQPFGTSCSAEYVKGLKIVGNSANLMLSAAGHTTLCSGVGFEISIRQGAAGTWANSFTDPSQTKVFDLDTTATKAFAAFVDTTIGGQVKVVWASSPTAAIQIPSATASVTALVGFDVDPTGGTVIARYDGGGTVGVFSGQSLGDPVQEVSTDCNRDAGVTAFTLDVAYVTCDPDDNSANFLRIRTNELEHITTVPLGQCDANHPIHSGEDDYSLNPDPEAFANEVRTFQLLSIDFTQAQGSSTDGIAGTGVGAIKYCRLQAAFGTSFETGKVGVLTADAARCISDDCRVNIDANRRIASAWSQYDPAGNPISHMCAVIPITIPGQSSSAAVVAADDSGTTKIYTWNRDTYTPGVALAESAAGIFSQGRGVGCGKGNRVLVSTATQLAAFNVTSQTQSWAPISLPAVPPQRGTAMSYDGKWGVQATSGSLCPSTATYGCAMMVNMTTGLTPDVSACKVPLPAGTFHEIRLTDHAVNLFIASSSEIDRWDMTSCTAALPGEGGFDDGCGPTAPVACPGTGGGGSGGGGSTCNPTLTMCAGGVISTGVGVPAGWTVAAFNGFLGVILMGAIGGGMWAAFGQRAVALAIGSLMGFILALLFKLFSLWVLIVVVLVSVAIIFLAIKRSAGGSGA